jgi:hypothetical protein
MTLMIQASPRLTEDKVTECIDPNLNSEYPPKAVAKVVTESNVNRLLMLYLFLTESLLLSSRRWQRSACSTKPISGPT